MPSYVQSWTGGVSCDETWAVSVHDCDQSGTYVSTATLGECGQERDHHAWVLGERVTDDEVATAAMCESYPLSEPAYHLRPADDEVAWVSPSWAGASRLQHATIVDDAGRELARSAWDYRDTVLGEPCFAAMTTAGFLCVPGNGATFSANAFPRVGSLFADSDCSTPAASPGGRCISGFAYAVPTAASCNAPAIQAVFRIGDPLDTIYMQDDSGACVVADALHSPGYTVTEIPLDSLARLRSRTE